MTAIGSVRTPPPAPLRPGVARGSLTLSAAAAATPNDVLKALGTGETGLTASEAAARLFEAGANRLPEAHGPGLPRELAGQLFHFFALILWAAAGLALLGGLPELAGGAQEFRAEHAARALARSCRTR